MGAALDRLGARECERIFSTLVELTGQSTGSRMGARCPWHSETTPGAFWYDPEKDSARCYSCDTGGDLIDVFCAVEGLPQDAESFLAFFNRFAPDSRRAPSQRPVAVSRTWQARNSVAAENQWRVGATAWVEKCAGRLDTDALYRLADWGITRTTATACRIGLQPEDRFIKFTEWGLPYAENAKGRERCIHLPAGLVFPVFSPEGDLLRVKVRLTAPKEDEPKYKAVVGGVPACYGIWGDPALKVWVVVETERDAMMLQQELGPYGIGAMAVGTASLAPDTRAHEILARAECILNALDNDAAGARPSWGFDPACSKFSWNMAYPHAIRWPVPLEYGKDPADMVGFMPIPAWALAGLPPHVRRLCQHRYAKERVRQCTDTIEI